MFELLSLEKIEIASLPSNILSHFGRKNKKYFLRNNNSRIKQSPNKFFTKIIGIFKMFTVLS